METLIVYGLVLVFFVLLAIFVMAVLANHPYAEPSAATGVGAGTLVEARGRRSGTNADSKVAYGVLAIIMTFLFVIMLLSERERSHVTSS